MVVKDGVETLAEPGVRISASATDLSDSLSDAGSALDDVPVVGDGVATAFDKASEASASMADAGDAEARQQRRSRSGSGSPWPSLPSSTWRPAT